MVKESVGTFEEDVDLIAGLRNESTVNKFQGITVPIFVVDSVAEKSETPKLSEMGTVTIGIPIGIKHSEIGGDSNASYLLNSVIKLISI
jgi:hypothetical protein